MLKRDVGDLSQTTATYGALSGDNADVGYVNLWLNSLLSHMDVSLN